MKKFMLSVVIPLFFLMSNLYAIDCPKTTIKHLQIEGASIYVFPKGQQWHLLGSLETIGTKEKYAALLAAQMSGRYISLRYPDGYDCLAYDLNIPTVMVRTY